MKSCVQKSVEHVVTGGLVEVLGTNLPHIPFRSDEDLCSCQILHLLVLGWNWETLFGFSGTNLNLSSFLLVILQSVLLHHLSRSCGRQHLRQRPVVQVQLEKEGTWDSWPSGEVQRTDGGTFTMEEMPSSPSTVFFGGLRRFCRTLLCLASCRGQRTVSVFCAGASASLRRVCVQSPAEPGCRCCAPPPEERPPSPHTPRLDRRPS